ncbi:MAG: AMP-binding protein, partial [Acidobacteriota bacterium]
ALVFEDRSMTFAELDAAANRIAHLLAGKSAGPGQRVGVCLRRGPEMVATLLGVLKTGAAYVPLDPTYPGERLTTVLEDAGASVLVTAGALSGRFPSFAGDLVVLDELEGALAAQPATALATAAGPEDVAYVIYTSGSTGRPKGVMVPHRAVTNFFAGMDRSVGCDGEDSLLAVTSISFDISVLELFWTLTRGCRVVLLAEDAVLGGGGSESREPLDFSLFYFSADDEAEAEGGANQ